MCMCVCVQCKAQVVSPTLFIAGFSAAANHGSHGVCKYGWCVECAGILGCVCVCVWGGGGGDICKKYTHNMLSVIALTQLHSYRPAAPLLQIVCAFSQSPETTFHCGTEFCLLINWPCISMHCTRPLCPLNEHTCHLNRPAAECRLSGQKCHASGCHSSRAVFLTYLI